MADFPQKPLQGGEGHQAHEQQGQPTAQPVQMTKKQRREQKKQDKLTKRIEAEKAKKRGKYIKLGIVAGVIVLVIGIVAVFWGYTPDATEIDDAGDTSDPFKGAEDAPIVIREFGDFQCPACGAAAPIVAEVVANNSDVKLVFNDFPLERIHPNAVPAAEIAECAYRAGGNDLFWKVHDIFYDEQSSWSSAHGARSDLMDLAVQAGADRDSLDECVKNDDPRDSVKVDQNQATSLRVNSTPTFFVNDERILGVQTLEEWNEILDRIREDLPEETESEVVADDSVNEEINEEATGDTEEETEEQVEEGEKGESSEE